MITQIGITILIMLGLITASFITTVLVLAVITSTIKAYINRDIGVLIAMTLIWCYVIGVALILIGSV